jgi:hypothetical protein
MKGFRVDSYDGLCLKEKLTAVIYCSENSSELPRSGSEIHIAAEDFGATVLSASAHFEVAAVAPESKNSGL